MDLILAYCFLASVLAITIGTIFIAFMVCKLYLSQKMVYEKINKCNKSKGVFPGNHIENDYGKSLEETKILEKTDDNIHEPRRYSNVGIHSPGYNRLDFVNIGEKINRPANPDKGYLNIKTAN